MIRSPGVPVLVSLRQGVPPALVMVVAVTVSFLMLLLVVPALRRALDLGVVGWPEVLVPPLAAVIALAGFEVAKVVHRAREGR